MLVFLFMQMCYNLDMKKSSLKRKSKSKTRKIQDELWENCKRIIRVRYRNKDGTWNCYTCEAKNISGTNLHTGHFIPSSICGAFLRYDLRNLRPQCYRCNIWLTGNGSTFYKNMVEREGQEYVDKIFEDRQKIVKASDYFIELLNKYKDILE